jgi:hypothetical protein
MFVSQAAWTAGGSKGAARSIAEDGGRRVHARTGRGVLAGRLIVGFVSACGVCWSLRVRGEVLNRERDGLVPAYLSVPYL